MKVIIAIDNNNGLAFNNRRQSRDRILIDDICNLIGKEKLYISPYSSDLFDLEAHKNITVTNNYLNAAQVDDYVFCESDEVNSHSAAISEYIVYRWNRDYPGDQFLTFNYQVLDLLSTEEFVGSSHDKITKERYRRKAK